MTARTPQMEPKRRRRAERAAAFGAGPAPAAGAASVLALQRWAGNRAVTALLARAPAPNAPPAKAPPDPKVTSLVVPDIGTIPLTSWSYGSSGTGVHGGSGGAGKGNVREIGVSAQQGSHSSAIAQAAVEGTPLGTVELVVVKDGKPVLRLKLHDALISSYSVSGSGNGDTRPSESWTISATSVEWEYSEAPRTAE